MHMSQPSPDVIVIGSGAGGGSLTKRLADIGLNVLLLERGGAVPREADNWNVEQVFRERKYSPFEVWKDRAGKNFRPSSWYNIGGSTKFFGTVMMRLRRKDFEAVEHAEGVSPAWPFSYEELEPYYTEAEHLFGVHGDPSRDPWEPPRSGPLPYPAVGSEPYVARVEDRLRAKGLHPFPLPVAVDLHPGGKCVRCGTCDGFPCAVGGKNDAETRCVEPALKTGRVVLWTGAFVRRLLLSADGRTINAVEVEHDGQTKTVSARVFALSAGAVNSALILMRSATGAFPNGLANSSDVVGRHYMTHNLTTMMAISLRENPTRFQKTLAFNDFYDGEPGYPFPMGNVQTLGKLQSGMLVAGAKYLPQPIARELTKRSFDILTTSEDLPNADNRVTLRNGEVQISVQANNMECHRRLNKRVKAILKDVGFPLVLAKTLPVNFTAAQCGTVRMGSDPAIFGTRSVLPVLGPPQSVRRGRVVHAHIGCDQSLADHRRAGAQDCATHRNEGFRRRYGRRPNRRGIVAARGHCNFALPEINMPDFIVIGGGSSGCVLAARLSEDPNVSVLLLEEGPEDKSPWIHLPVTYYKTGQGDLVARYQWTPNFGHTGDPNPTMVQARVLGGGSSVNAMVYLRGQPRDYDQWHATGAHGWGWNDVLPYYKRCESNDRFANELHGTDGPLPVSDQEFTHPMSRIWVQACQQAGLPYNPDFNSGQQEGCGLYQINARNGRRGSTAVSYLKPARKRKNLIVQTNARALRIVFDGKRAVGVEVVIDGSRKVIRANREVIVTAGAINTPKLLMISGIGNADHLKQHGIAAVQHLPGVGQNLQDHVEVSIIHEVNGPFSYDKYKKPHWQIAAGLEYLLFRRGPCTANIVEGGAFFRSSLNEDRPDLQCCFMPGAGIEEGVDTVPGGNGTTLNICQTRPRSVGWIGLKSSDPFEAPYIQPNYLQDEYDIEVMCEGVEFGREIMSRPVIAKHLRREYAPGNVRSRKDILAYVRKQAHAALHPMGTCKMGHDDLAVVDTDLKVHGIEGLRVCDNSIGPNLVSCNTNGVAIMIAEKAADHIRKGHGLKALGPS